MATPTVIFSDDEPMLLSAYIRMGKRHGLNVVGVLNGAELVERVATLRPALVLLDIRQPIDGRDLLANLKKNPATAGVPVMAISANEDQFVRHTCFELGAIDFEVKPFDIGVILKVLRLVGRPSR